MLLTAMMQLSPSDVLLTFCFIFTVFQPLHKPYISLKPYPAKTSPELSVSPLLAAQLCPALTNCKALKVLDLGGNNIGPEGAAELATALKGHEMLRMLEMG